MPTEAATMCTPPDTRCAVTCPKGTYCLKKSKLKVVAPKPHADVSSAVLPVVAGCQDSPWSSRIVPPDASPPHAATATIAARHALGAESTALRNGVHISMTHWGT